MSALLTTLLLLFPSAVTCGCWEEKLCCKGRNNSCSVYEFVSARLTRMNERPSLYANERPSVEYFARSQIPDGRSINHERVEVSTKQEHVPNNYYRYPGIRLPFRQEVTHSAPDVVAKDRKKRGNLEQRDLWKCYCDEVCRKLNDCCDDIDHYCRAINCEVSEWSQWNVCSPIHECGVGSQTRNRELQRRPEGGGQACPEMIQTRGCYLREDECDDRYKEVAYLLPYKYAGLKQRYAEFVKLKAPAKDDEATPSETSLQHNCTVFEVAVVSGNCSEYKLRTGNKFCSECEPRARHDKTKSRCIGEGIDGRKTPFLIPNSSCYGLVVKKEARSPCYCRQQFSNWMKYIFI